MPTSTRCGASRWPTQSAHIDRVLAAAAEHGRRPGISLSLRPILGATEEAAWDRARDILERARELADTGRVAVDHAPQNVGSQRLLDAAARGDVHDERLYTAIAEATGAHGNTTALVGTVEQVAESLLATSTSASRRLLIRGFDPYDDARRLRRCRPRRPRRGRSSRRTGNYRPIDLRARRVHA